MDKKRIAAIIILLLVSALCAFIAIRKFASDWRAEQKYARIREQITEEQEPLTEQPVSEEEEPAPYVCPEWLSIIMEENPYVVGWIRIEGTKIDYPIVQHESEYEYFLHRDIDGNDSFPGAIFIDPNQDIVQGTLHVLYGHNMINGTMFADVLKFLDPEFLSTHQNIKVWTKDKLVDLEPIKCYYDIPDTGYRNVFKTENEAATFITERAGQVVEPGNFYVLLTCSYYPLNGQMKVDERTYLICRERGESKEK